MAAGLGLRLFKQSGSALCSLPRDSYLVTYGDNTEERFDVVQGLQSDIFDHYWDKYRDVRGMKWTDGKANPKMWGYKAPESKKRK